MTDTVDTNAHHHEDDGSKVIFGFWIFILTSFISFATLFATYAVLHNNTYGGIGAQDVLRRLSYALLQSLIFLSSSFTLGLAIIAYKKGLSDKVKLWMTVTFLIGLLFIGLEFREFARLVHDGNTWQNSAFLSSFFTLVGFHSVNVIVGLLWMIVLMIQFSMKGFTATMQIRFSCLGLFWDFLNIIWIFIFTIVYLMGAI
ncbi:MAG: cytochrome o ubiquinol oxidase subunit III [Legionellales bacterium]|nr:cytochrome o ubiquinol oxidase subunit III [Legionellales bacterium]